MSTSWRDEMFGEIHVMYGLPGSGKTHFCHEAVTTAKTTDCKKYLDLDAYAKKRPKANFEDFADTEVYNFIKGRTIIPYIDGLITTHEQLGIVVRSAIDAKQTAYYDSNNIKVYVHAWNEDRETCKFNDIGRREISSRLSIDNLPYETIRSFDDIKAAVGSDYSDKAQFFLERHLVIRRPGYKQYFAERGMRMDEGKVNTDTWHDIFNNSRYIYSDSWCTGGTICSYTGSSSTVYAEEPAEFYQMVELFDLVDPKMSFKTGVRIFKEAVDVEENPEKDYYGGEVGYQRYKLDLQKMYDIICDEEERMEE